MSLTTAAVHSGRLPAALDVVFASAIRKFAQGIVEIRADPMEILHKQGKSLHSIACEVGCSANTVRKYLATRDAPIFRPTVTPRESILKPFEAYLREWIASAASNWISATVLWREIQSTGFDGGQRIWMQVAWVEFRRRKGANLFAFFATLGYSRATSVELVSGMRLDTL